MNPLTYKIYSSVTQIDRDEWNRLIDDIPEGYDFFRAVESSHLEGIAFSYIMIFQNSVPFLLVTAFTSDLDLGIALEGGGQKILNTIRKAFPRFLIMRTLFIGSPFGENAVIGFNRSTPQDDASMAELLKALMILCKQEHLSCIMFKDLLDKDLLLVQPLARQGFFKAASFPSVVIELNFKSMEEYLLKLGGQTRKDLRRKIKKAQAEGPIEVRVVDHVTEIVDEIYALYLNTYNAGTVHFEKLTKDFFINISQNMAGTKFFLYYVNGRLAAFNLCFLHNDTLIDKFIGFDYALARRYNLYFFSWYFNIEWCLNNNVRLYQVGQTDYEAKLRLGGKLIPLHVLARHNNTIMNSLLRMASKFLTPKHNDLQLKSHE